MGTNESPGKVGTSGKDGSVYRKILPEKGLLSGLGLG